MTSNNVKQRATATKTSLVSDQRGKTQWETPYENIVFRVIRFIAIFLFACTATLIVWASVPVFLTVDPLLRKMGIKRYYSVLEVLSRAWAKSMLWIMNIRVRTEGLELLNNEKEVPTTIMYQHTSYLDPVILQAYCPIPSKYIFKKELIFLLPVVFVLAYIAGHIPINRKKKDSAIESINEAASIMLNEKRSISISPEGTRSRDGNIQEFKKGPFHLAIKSNSVIIPVCFFGNYEIWNIHTTFPYNGETCIRFHSPKQISKSTSIDTLLSEVRESMIDSVSKPPKDFNPFPSKPSASHAILYLIINLLLAIYTLNHFNFISLF
ncbi:hypothetical protein CYY_004024 [Polysphondylium violaceum]|uniref:Phospholipid/glycerol acyltransferase domain-containing protein n=1 Tax=Polysphondylium violaceum TaxID=133409 RepID=A0A8J4PXL8_9MYCE|nr:hypothetical protein CYY_004024 [Polysphondylium violaceum]